MTEITDFNFAENDFTAADLAKFELIKSEEVGVLNELADVLNQMVAAKVAKLSQEKDEFYGKQVASQELESDIFYNHFPCGYFSTAGNGIINKINDTLLDWLGYTKEEIIGKVTWQSLLSVGGKMYFETHYSPLLQLQGFVQEISFEMVKKDKTRLPILINTKQIRDENRNVQINYSTVFDVSQRKSYEKELLIAKRIAEEQNKLIHETNEKLLASEEELKSTIEEIERLNENLNKLVEYTFKNASIPIYFVLEDASIYNFNNIGAENLGYTSEELHTLKIYDLDKDYDEKKWASVWAELKANKKITIETQQKKKDGTFIDVIITANYVKYGDLELNCSFVLDVTEKKKLEDNLKLSAFTIDNAAWGLVYFNADGTIYNCNLAFAKIYGNTSVAEMKTKTAFDFGSSHTTETWKQYWDELKQKKNLHYIVKRTKKDGTIIDVEINANMIQFGDLELNCVYVNDITEKKKAEERLKLSDYIIQKATAAIFLLRPDGSFYDFNEAAYAMLGYTKEEFGMLNQMDLDPRLNLGIILEGFEVLRREGKVSFQATMLKKNGALIDVEITSTFIVYDGLELKCSFITEITDKKKAEAEIYSINELLQRQTNRLLLATRSAKLGIWDRDLENDSIFWDEGMYKLYDVAATEFKTNNEAWVARLHEEDRAKILDEMQSNITNNNEFNSEFRIVWSDASIHYIKTTGFIQRVDGKPKRIIGVSWDVTKDKEAALEKEKLLEELVENNLELKQFSYITTHNLRAPLTNLVSICDIIQPGTGTDALTLQLIDSFKISTRHLNETLNDLIDVLIIKENRNIQKDQLTFEEIFKKISESLSRTLQEKKVIINVDFSAAPSVIFANAYLESVFLNLLTNAVKYRHPNRDPIVNIKTNKEPNGDTKLTFSDNGIGINMALAKDKIFGLYKRFHNNADSKGIGLYLIHSQITTLGGKIDVESEVNIGTTFTITFK